MISPKSIVFIICALIVLVLARFDCRFNLAIMAKIVIFKVASCPHIHFFQLCFLSRTLTIHSQQRKGEAISIGPQDHFHPFHRRLGISRSITAASSPLHIASSQT